MSNEQPGLLASLVKRFAPNLKHPQLFLILLGLLAVDLVVVDPIPFIDEAVLALLTILVGSWRRRPSENTEDTAEPAPPSPKDVTDLGSDDGP